MAESVFTRCLSLICPVGLTPESAFAAMRAGIDAFADIAYADNTGESIIGAAVPGLDPSLWGRARLVELLCMAMESALAHLPPDFSLAELPVILCTRESDRPGAKVNGILAEIEARLKFAFHREFSLHVANGQVSLFSALAHARLLFNQRWAEACLIASVDSLLDARALLWLDQGKRLKTSMNTDGVIPGEGAGVMLVSATPFKGAQLAVLGLGFAQETATVFNEDPMLGRGMAAAVRDALGEVGLAMHEVDFRLADVAGESYAFEELVLAQSRLMRQTRKCQSLWHPATSIGDCGASAGVVQFGWIAQAFAQGYAPGSVALVHGSTPSGPRSAAVVTRI